MKASLACFTFILFHFSTLALAKSRILGGSDAAPGQFPHLVSIYDAKNSDNICGGAILTDFTILTAGHCCEMIDQAFHYHWSDLVIKAGDLTLSDNAGTEQTVKVFNHTLHPDYSNTVGPKNDVCLLFTDSSLSLSHAVNSKPLAETEVEPGTACQLAGWGSDMFGGNPTDHLQFVDVKITEEITCQSAHPSTFDASIMLCAAEEGKDACEGDNGSPLVCNNLIVGINSFGRGCGNPLYPRVFTKVSKYTNWIKENWVGNEPTSTVAPTTTSTSGSWAVMAPSSILILLSGFLCFL